VGPGIRRGLTMAPTLCGAKRLGYGPGHDTCIKWGVVGVDMKA
jgi:hypothetical protein